ncbi:hypothetical protein BGZ81_007486 [Podila clonocystis]|nr:hypothetical protein BGZ81_007486 [Podila clonocystis]
MAQCPASESSTMLSTENSSTNLPDTNAQPSPPTPPQEPVSAKQILQPQPQPQPQEQQPQERLQPQEQLQPQPGQSKQARPVSEIFSNHIPANGKSFQSPEAEAIDKWFEDLSHYEQTLEEMAVVSLDHVFKEELSTIESWFSVLSEAERTAALYSLLQHSSQVQVRFFITVLQQLAKKDPVGALLSPTAGEKDSAQTQLHGAMAKAEKEVSQRLLSVLPIQPPTTSPLDRPTAGRRLYDRHSMTMGESEEYSRLFRRDNKRNSDILGLSNHLSSLHPANTTDGLGNGIPHINTNNTNSSHCNSNGNSVNNTKPNGTSGPIGSGSVFSESGARVNQFKLPATPLSSANRVSTPLFSNRPKSVCEGDASSIFSSNWNFASLGGPPLAGPSTGTSSGSSGSPGNIGDRTSLGRPKSVGGAEWMLNSTTNPQPGADGVEKSWTPLLMSPTMGGFHGGSNGTGHSFGSSSGYSGSNLAVERPKSVTEADLAKLNISQWSINGPNNTNLLGSRSDDPMKPNRRRTLLRPSAIISNVPVTVLEGDEKLLSASANTSSINIVSSLFDEPGSSTGTMPSLTSALTASQAPSMFQYSSQAFSQPPQHLPLQHQQQQQQYYQQKQVSQIPSLSLQSQPGSHYHQHASSRAQSPMTSPLPSPITSGFRSRPASRPTSPGLTAHHNYSSVRNVWSSNGNHGYNNHNSYNNYNNHYQHGNMMGHHPDYHQKRHLSPPDAHSRGTSVLDDDYMSDTSDMSSLGMTPHRSMGKDKKQYEGVDFELLQDTPAWLRSLRLHKYNNIFEGMNWREIVNLSDGDLINKGVAALGARRKMLKVFEQVRKEMLLQGMAI